MKVFKTIWLTQSSGRPAKLYIIRCWNEEESFFKIGVTFKKIKRRFAGKVIMPYEYEVITLFESYNLQLVHDLEIQFLFMTEKFSYMPDIKFKGSSECRSSIDNINLEELKLHDDNTHY